MRRSSAAPRRRWTYHDEGGRDLVRGEPVSACSPAPPAPPSWSPSARSRRAAHERSAHVRLGGDAGASARARARLQPRRPALAASTTAPTTQAPPPRPVKDDLPGVCSSSTRGRGHQQRGQAPSRSGHGYGRRSGHRVDMITSGTGCRRTARVGVRQPQDHPVPAITHREPNGPSPLRQRIAATTTPTDVEPAATRRPSPRQAAATPRPGPARRARPPRLASNARCLRWTGPPSGEHSD